MTQKVTAVLLNRSLDYVVHNPIQLERPQPYLRIAVMPEGATLVRQGGRTPSTTIVTDEYQLAAVGRGVAFYVWDRRIGQ